MQTYTHFIMTAALNRALKHNTDLDVRTRPLLLGAVLPDAGLIVLSTGYFIQRALENGDGPLFGAEYDALYFENPVWIITHNFFHAPLMVLFFIMLGVYFGRVHGKGWGWALVWFGIGCGLHSFVDILTHHNDGPLLFFPFDWSTRFESPVSYWDPRHYGGIVAPLEHLMNVLLLLYLFIGRRRDRRRVAGESPA